MGFEPTITIDGHDDGHVQYMYYLEDKHLRPFAVCLDSKWARRRPAKLEFVVTERGIEMIGVMLIERSEPVAHHVQMVDGRVCGR
jgi:hypothetical protein